jgi:hypothetical protein
MSEWSKEPDLRSGSVSCVGSNPTRCTTQGVVAQMVERSLSMREVVRSMLTDSSILYSVMVNI